MKVDDRFFRDDHGRVVFLRGINLSSNCKLPYEPYIPSHHGDGFFEDTDVSFIGRPFPLSEASQHFRRLQLWGFNFLRYCVTWEALEHEGPGCHDTDFMDYVVSILQIAKAYGFRCFIDPHQDAWSRSCGGSGAPGWTVRMVGFDPEHFDVNNAAFVQNTFQGEQFPRMIWSTNNYKLAAATMLTLFFAGNLYAPKLKSVGAGQTEACIQDFFQRCFIQSFCALAQRLGDAGLLDDVVIGYDTINEPSPGFIGARNLSDNMEDQILRYGLTPTPIQCMKLGEGISCHDVAFYKMTVLGPKLAGKRLLDPSGVRAWKDNNQCIWADHGVWDPSTGEVLVPDYFYRHPDTNEPIDFYVDCWKPFVRNFTNAIRAVHNNAIMFIEPPILAIPPEWNDPDDPDHVVYAPHFYDGMTLMMKKFYRFNVNVVGLQRKHVSLLRAIAIGSRAVKNCIANQLLIVKTEGLQNIGEVPCLIGEIGIPFDMNHGRSYVTGDYTEQIRAMDASLGALERNFLSYTLWNYCADNSHERGDQWNGEDLSIFSIDDAERVRPRGENALQPPANSIPADARKLRPKLSLLPEPFDPYIGGRALPAVIRPFPRATCGVPLSWSYDYTKRLIIYQFQNTAHVPTQDSATEIFLPPYLFPGEEAFDVWVSDGSYVYDKEEYLLRYIHSDLSLHAHEIKVQPAPGSIAPYELPTSRICRPCRSLCNIL